MDIDGQLRVVEQKTRHAGAVVKMAVGQQNTLGSTAGGSNQLLYPVGFVAWVDDKADLFRLVTQHIAVCHNGAHT